MISAKITADGHVESFIAPPEAGVSVTDLKVAKHGKVYYIRVEGKNVVTVQVTPANVPPSIPVAEPVNNGCHGIRLISLEKDELELDFYLTLTLQGEVVAAKTVDPLEKVDDVDTLFRV
jgi:hypothetical protein